MRTEFETIEWAEPPIGDLVEKSVAKGRRMRWARRMRAGGAGLAVLAVAGVATGFVVHHADPAVPAPAVITAAAPSAAASSAAPADENRVKATPAGLLELLTQKLPDGTPSHFAGETDSDGNLAVQLHLNRGQGTGEVLLNVIKSSKMHFSGVWTPLGNGIDYQVRHLYDNCRQHTIVLVRHPGGSLLQFNLTTCIGKEGGKSPQILSVSEAAQIGADPRWGLTIDPALNQQGAARFPHLSTDLDK
jgi:hypothetical protein